MSNFKSITKKLLGFPSIPSRNRFPVHCPKHGDTNSGYLVCTCIANSFSRVHSIVHPTPTRLGEITCNRAAPHKADRDGAVEFVLMCGKCVVDLDLDKRGSRLT